jgi:flagellar protein FlaG
MNEISRVGALPAETVRESGESRVTPGVRVNPDVALPKKAVLTAAETAFDPKQMKARLQEAVDQLNEQLSRNDTALRFGIDNRIDRMVVTVRSSGTGEVVRQIPAEEILRVAHKIEDLKGILYDKNF